MSRAERTLIHPECCAFKVHWGRDVSHPPALGEVSAAARAAGDWGTGFGVGPAACSRLRLWSCGALAPAPAGHAPLTLSGHCPGSGRARPSTGHGKLPAGRLCGGLDRRLACRLALATETPSAASAWCTGGRVCSASSRACPSPSPALPSTTPWCLGSSVTRSGSSASTAAGSQRPVLPARCQTCSWPAWWPAWSLSGWERPWTSSRSGCRCRHNRFGTVFFRGITVNAVRGFPMSAAMFLGYELSLQAIRGDHAVTSP
ncbi:solute carrier family 25 member 48 isoform X8 [Pan paniscus]|uniref:solute carrier family 25 member 48 isoform X8 n=1 Tax=Pan paniscus TaxID=9597 RepID=UPI00155F703C|nr:solute carrier family 25 member 48 isoform X8 [Pan paniscus]